MRDPYEVLEINKGATKDEIRDAYRKMVKKYHPDQYANNPLSDLAAEKLKEINEAYDALTKNGQTSYHTGGQNRNYRTQYESRGDFSEVRNLINRGLFQEADAKLEATSNRDAQWHYLKSVVYFNQGWYDQGRTHLMQAVQMDPQNLEYQNALRRIHFQQRSTGSYQNQNGQICNICGGLLCADCLCECCGGDLIGCC